MADVKKINGYNIKDASARDDISALDTRVGALETTIDTPNTGLSARVGALENNAIISGDYAVITGSMTVDSNESADATESYPTGFTKDNCYVVCAKYTLNDSAWDNTIPMNFFDAQDISNITGMINYLYSNNGINIWAEGPVFSENDVIAYNLLLMKYETAVEETPE